MTLSVLILMQFSALAEAQVTAREQLMSLAAQAAESSAPPAVQGRPVSGVRHGDRQAELNRALLSETARGNLEDAARLIALGAQPYAKDAAGVTALMYAARSGHLEVVRLLLEKGASIDSRNDLGENALVLASYYQHWDTVRFLIERGARVHNASLLHAAASGNLEITRLLLDRGANPNATFLESKTPLHVATKRSSIELVELLLARRADPNLADDYGATPFLLACEKGLNWMSLLTRYGANVAASDKDGNTAVHKVKTAAEIDFLLARGLSLDSKNGRGHTALSQAVTRCNGPFVADLLDRGANKDVIWPQEPYYKGITPVISATLIRCVPVLQTLIARRADLNYRIPDYGVTALGLARRYAKQDASYGPVVSLLAAAGAQE